MRSPVPGCGWALLAALVLLLLPGAAGAQLLSPGKLTAAHADLEGIRNCTACHRLRERGIANDRCLDCHVPLRTRIAEGRGLHATLGGRDCAGCHKDHFGRDFESVRLDTTAFAHDTVGFELSDAHRALACRECHTPSLVRAADVRAFKEEHAALDRTYLGLGTDCESCHAEDSPHERQFRDKRCTDCHDQISWENAHDIEHDRTRYPLTGRHRTVKCAECHDRGSANGTAGSRYRGLRFDTCTACHRDPHERRMGPECESCHTTAAWAALDRNRFERDFDHGATRFRLEGRHADAACSSCHDRSASLPDIRMEYVPGPPGQTYPRPRADDCLSCHVDYHDGVFADGPSQARCDDCHGQDGWLPTSYDLSRHNDGSTFVLDGGHLATPCGSCHAADGTDAPARFRMEHDRCATCHAADDPHDGQFADRRCDDCHGTQDFIVRGFDHEATDYPLDGRHRDVPCAACHELEFRVDGRSVQRFRPLGTRCEDCHGEPR